jgi:hypothetical protein
MEPDFLSPDAEHVHDQTITSVGINEPGASLTVVMTSSV